MAADDSVETVPGDVRRTTLIVRDIDRSLVLYRDILGFRPRYDNEIAVTGAGLPAGEPNSDTRLVILPDPGAYPTRLGIGDGDAAFERIKALDGVTVRLRGMTFFDPDGYCFELNERLD